MRTIATHQLVAFLKTQTRGLGPAARFQMVHRPRICPFDDLLTLIPEGRRILDVGCGNGAFLLLLARYRSPSHLMGVDIDPRAVARAEGLLARCPFVQSYRVEAFDGRSLPPAVGTVDYVLMVDVLHHVPRRFQKRFLGMLFHAMQPGATLVLKDIDASRPLLAACNLLHDLLLARQRVHAIDAGGAAQWLRSTGFNLAPARRQRRLWYPHYTLVARKP
jgi:SAM-dependent methyltransferase